MVKPQSNCVGLSFWRPGGNYKLKPPAVRPLSIARTIKEAATLGTYSGTLSSHCGLKVNLWIIKQSVIICEVREERIDQ